MVLSVKLTRSTSMNCIRNNVNNAIVSGSLLNHGSLQYCDSFIAFGSLRTIDSFILIGSLGCNDSFVKYGTLTNNDSFILLGSLSFRDSFASFGSLSGLMTRSQIMVLLLIVTQNRLCITTSTSSLPDSPA